jgi:hypothetical protein
MAYCRKSHGFQHNLAGSKAGGVTARFACSIDAFKPGTDS